MDGLLSKGSAVFVLKIYPSFTKNSIKIHGIAKKGDL